MKLLYITSLSGNRINGFMRSAIIAARELGIDFTIACNMDHADKQLYAEDCKYYGIEAVHIDCDRNPLAWKNYTVAKKQLTELMKRKRYNVVHCNTPVGGVLGRICAKEAGIPYVIYQAHGFHFWKDAPAKNWLMYYPVEHLLAHYTDMLITINNEDYKRAQKFHLKKNGRVVKVPGVGVDLSKFDADFRFSEEGNNIRMGLRKKWMINAAAYIFVSVGELNDNKNQEVAMRALAKTNNPNFYYIICGEGNKKEYLVHLAEKLGIADRVKLLGYQNNIAEILLACDCFVFTSFREGLPGALMEAMASGLPCIASRIRGCTDLLEGSDYLFNPSDADELAGKMIRIVNSEECQKEVVRNRKSVVNFDLEHAVKSLKDLYESIGDQLNEKSDEPSNRH